MNKYLTVLVSFSIMNHMIAQTTISFDNGDFHCEEPILTGVAIGQEYVAIGSCATSDEDTLLFTGLASLIDNDGQIVGEKQYVFEKEAHGSLVKFLTDGSIVMLFNASRTSRTAYLVKRYPDGEERTFTIDGVTITQIEILSANQLLALGYGDDEAKVLKIDDEATITDQYILSDPGSCGHLDVDLNGNISLLTSKELICFTERLEVVCEKAVFINYAESVQARHKNFGDHILLIKSGNVDEVQNILRLDKDANIVQEIEPDPSLWILEEAIISDDGSFVIYGIDRTSKYNGVVQFYDANFELQRSHFLRGHRSAQFSHSSDGSLVVSAYSSDPDSNLLIVKFDQTTNVQSHLLRDCDMRLTQNPVNDFLEMKSSEVLSGVRILDVRGGIHHSARLQEFGSQRIMVPTDHLSNGLYFISSADCQIKSFIVQH